MNSLFQSIDIHNSRKKRRRNVVRAAEVVLLAAGFICVGWFGWSMFERRIGDSYGNYSLEARLRGEEPSVVGYVQSLFDRGEERSRQEALDEPTPPAEQRAERPKRPPMASGAVVGRIEVPRIKVSAVVREGSDDKTLKRAAGHVPYTALPGEHGNVGIAAHRDTHFRNLRGIRKGDRVRMVTTWGVYEYEVESLKVVMPEAVHVLNPTPEPALTLVTCYPFNYVGSAPKRFIVRARQVEPPVVEARTRNRNTGGDLSAERIPRKARRGS
jgi:sortase A